MNEYFIPLILLLVGAYFVYLAGRILGGKVAGVIATLIMFVALGYLINSWGIVKGQILEKGLLHLWIYRGGKVYFVIDPLGYLLSFLAITLGALVSFYSIKYMAEDYDQEKYYALLILMVGGMVGLVTTGDIFNLYVFYELMCISSYVLVAFRKKEWFPVEAGLKYLFMSTLGTALVIYGISIIYRAVGTLELVGIREAILHNSFLVNNGVSLVKIAMILMLTGFGIKAALVPLHTWLPDAHGYAPSGISAMLSGILIETGFIALLRCWLVVAGINLNFGMALIVLAILSMFVGNIMALVQSSLKRMLAYSSIAQMGYIVLGIGIALQFSKSSGLVGGLFHLFNHTWMKGLAFLCAGAIIWAVHSYEIDDMKGIAYKMPLVGIAFGVAVLGLAGVPPLSGFMSKWLIYKAGLDIHNSWGWIFTVCAVFNSIFSLGYYLPALIKLYSKEEAPSVKQAPPLPSIMSVPIVLMGLAVIIIGIFPQTVINLIEPAKNYIFNLIGGY